MRARLTKMGAVLAALAALALGGSALASAAHKTTPPTPPVTQTQSNQVAPGTSAEVADSSVEAQSGAADADNVQQGDQTGTDQADSQSEQAGSESGPSDGPGGYADTSPSADTQQQGEH
jgi:hypothetical protein